MQHGDGKYLCDGSIGIQGYISNLFEGLTSELSWAKMTADNAQLDPAAEYIIQKIASKMKHSGHEISALDNSDGIPAGYTYLLQFIFHDLTRSRIFSSAHFDGYGLGNASLASNLNSPQLDLDTLYGGGIEVSPHLYERHKDGNAARYRFRMGKLGPAKIGLGVLPSNSRTCPYDVARIRDTVVDAAGKIPTGGGIDPVIGDLRNDTHVLLSQLLVLFMHMHNKVADALAETGEKPENIFRMTRRFIVRSYRHIIINDVMRKLIDGQTHVRFFGRDQIVEDGTSEMIRHSAEFIFAVARIGHGMVRNQYPVNSLFLTDQGIIEDGFLDTILTFSSFNKRLSSSRPALSHKLPVPENWIVDWRLFFKIDETDPVYAQRISPLLAPRLMSARFDNFAAGDALQKSLPYLDMERCIRFKLPTGQQIASKMGVHALSPCEMRAMKIPFGGVNDKTQLDRVLDGVPEFRRETPLSYYVLQEAALLGNNGTHLGPVGSEITARTILNALICTPDTHTMGIYDTREFDTAQSERSINTMKKFIDLMSMDSRNLAELVKASTQEQGQLPSIRLKRGQEFAE